MEIMQLTSRRDLEDLFFLSRAHFLISPSFHVQARLPGYAYLHDCSWFPTESQRLMRLSLYTTKMSRPKFYDDDSICFFLLLQTLLSAPVETRPSQTLGSITSFSARWGKEEWRHCQRMRCLVHKCDTDVHDKVLKYCTMFIHFQYKTGKEL